MLALLALVAMRTGPARADSIRDAVEGHLDQGLEEKQDKPPPKKKPPPKRSQPKPSPKKSQRPHGDNAVVWSTEQEPEQEQPKDPDPLPRRVFGENFKFDPKVGVGYRGWLAQDYPLVSVPHTGYFTWSIETKARLFRYISLRRGYYESNGLSTPRNQTASTAEDVGKLAPKAAWLLGVIGLEISRAWQPIISYETRAFEATAQPKAPVRIVPRSASADDDFTLLPETTQPLRMVSGFETFVAGVRYDHSKSSSAVIGGSNGSLPPFYLGLGLIQYSKPYQVRVGGDVLGELLFDAKFRGAGLAYGLDTSVKAERPFIDLSGQVGFGEVKLLDDFSLNDGLPAHWMIGYLQGNVTLGYLHPLLRTRPTVFIEGALNGGGMTFFFFKTKAEEGEDTTSAPLNWDFLWGARVAVIVPL